MGGFTFKTREIDRGWKRIQNLARSIKQDGSYVKAGVLGDHDGREDGELGNVELAMIQEFGTADGHIPERSFVRGPFEAHKAEYQEAFAKLLGKVLEGEIDLEKALNLVGLAMSKDMKAAILTSSGGNEPFPPNAPSTIAKKGSSRPLVNTGQLLRSIAHAVVVKAKDEPGEEAA